MWLSFIFTRGFCNAVLVKCPMSAHFKTFWSCSEVFMWHGFLHHTESDQCSLEATCLAAQTEWWMLFLSMSAYALISVQSDGVAATKRSSPLLAFHPSLAGTAVRAQQAEDQWSDPAEIQGQKRKGGRGMMLVFSGSNYLLKTLKSAQQRAWPGHRNKQHGQGGYTVFTSATTATENLCVKGYP